MEEDSEILKQDVLGRVTVPKEKREALLDAFEAGGMSGQAFAKHHGIHVQTFASWIQKRRRSRGDYDDDKTRRKLRMGKKKTPAHKSAPTTTHSLNLVEVEMTDTPSLAEALEITLPGGAVAKVVSENQLGLLKSLLSELSC